MLINDLTESFAAQIAQSKEDAVRLALEQAIGPIVDIAHVAHRVSVTRVYGSKVETWRVDGRPILEIHDPVFEFDGFKMTAKQNYRRINPPTAAAP